MVEVAAVLVVIKIRAEAVDASVFFGKDVVLLLSLVSKGIVLDKVVVYELLIPALSNNVVDPISDVVVVDLGDSVAVVIESNSVLFDSVVR